MSTFNSSATFPHTRLRRMRRDKFSRDLMREHQLSCADLIYPIFIRAGSGVREPVASMPGVYRYSLDTALEHLTQCHKDGISIVALFPVLDSTLKDPQGSAALDPEGLVPRALQLFKRELPDLGLMTDIALDPYTSHGQDGVIDAQGYILNDQTVEILCAQALLYARNGADILAPSDMMDGRVGKIRHALEQAQLPLARILAYSAKYASAFYGPFRDAVGSASALGKSSKETYQMDPANGNEALREVALDIQEGADMVMVKPGMPYLDILWRVKQAFGLPTVAYQVSGEYSMIKAAAQNQWLDEVKVVEESLLAFKRAGADAIITYFAADCARRWASR